MFISSLWNVKEPTHYSRRVGDEAPGVVAVLCSECALSSRIGRLGIMSPKRLVVCEATKEKTAVSQKGVCRVLGQVDVDVDVDAIAPPSGRIQAS